MQPNQKDQKRMSDIFLGILFCLSEFQSAYPMFSGENYAKAYKMAYEELVSSKRTKDRAVETIE